MNISRSKHIVILSLAFFIGMIAVSQILNDEAQAISLCSNTCNCVTCGTASVPAKVCVDFWSYCRGPRYVRNCGEYCARWPGVVRLPVEY